MHSQYLRDFIGCQDFWSLALIIVFISESHDPVNP